MRRLRNLRSRWLDRQRRVPAPAEYWEQRAPDLVHGYDHPETWPERGWMSAGVEDEVVPQLLREHGIESALVVGAGTGRQYDYATDLGIRVSGFDISPSLVDAARERHPEVTTVVDDVIGADTRHDPVDAVLTTAVLQHVPPTSVADAVRSIDSLAGRMIVLRETTWLAKASTYQWAHDYDDLFADWEIVQRVVTDSNDRCRVELRALVRRSPQ